MKTAEEKLAEALKAGRQLDALVIDAIAFGQNFLKATEQALNLAQVEIDAALHREIGLEEENERLRAGRDEAMAAHRNEHKERMVLMDSIEAALILLPEQPAAAMNALRGEGVSDGSG